MGLGKSECIAIANEAGQGEMSPERLSATIEVLKHGIEEIKTWEDELEDSLDYIIERLLEDVAKALSVDVEILEKAGIPAQELEDLLTKGYLYIAQEDMSLSGAYQEIVIRAAEALGELARGTDALDDHIRRLDSENYRDRLWAANAIKVAAPDQASELLSRLADDPYCDEDACYPVREAAGFSEDD